MTKYNKQSGFTIIELLVVIVIIGILATIAIVTYSGIQQRAYVAVLQSDLSNASQTLEIVNAQNNSYPADLTSAALKASPGTTYQYTYTLGTNSYCLTGTNSNISWYIDSNSMLKVGGCPGHGVNGASAITNLITNPSFETGTLNITPTLMTVAQSSLWASNGIYSLATTPNSVSYNDSYASPGGDLGAMRLGMTAGKTYTFSATVRIPTSLTGTLSPYAGCLLAVWNTSGYVSQPSCPPGARGASGIYPVSLTFTVPVGSTEAFVRLMNGASSGGGVVYWDSVMLTEGSTNYNYADGSSSGWIWNGTANVSTSTGPPT